MVGVLAILAGVATGFGLASGLVPSLSNVINEASYLIYPNRPLDPDLLVTLFRRKAISDSDYLWGMRKLGYDAGPAIQLLQASTILPTLTELVGMRMRGLITVQEYAEYAGKLGYEADDAEKYYKTNLQTFDANTLIALRFRKLITDKEYIDLMSKIGYSEEQSSKLLKLAEYYPTPADLVRFAVREVYTPATRQKFGMDEDLPPEYLEACAKAGLPEDQARNYWAAHWELPSPNMGYEMFQRGIINKEELELLLKSLDIMPFWRDKLIKLAFSPYTRVDARRMYAAGVLSFEELVKTFKDLGYDDEHAQKMAQWTATSAVEEERTLTKSQIIELYNSGEFTREQAVKNLKLIGYSDESAEYILSLQDHEQALKQQKDYMSVLKTLYINGAITYEELHDEATKLNLSSLALEKFLLECENGRQSNTKMPEKTDLLAWLKKKLITPDEFINRMLMLGYTENDAKLYLRSVM